jgi:hypothetical protein
MDLSRVTYRLTENLRKVVLDHNDELRNIKQSLKEIKHYFSFKMLIIYFMIILTHVITITFWVSKQETKIDALTKEIEHIKGGK